MERHATLRFLLALTLSTVMAGCAASENPVPGNAARAREYVTVLLDTLWLIGGQTQPEDTVLINPWELAVGPEHLYVVDGQANRVAALRRQDGGLEWLVGRRGSGPGEFINLRGATVLPTGRLAVADVGNKRVTLLTPAGKHEGDLPLEDVPYVTSICALGDGALLIAAMRTSKPIVRLDLEDGSVRAYDLPWPDLHDAPGLLTYPRVVETPEQTACYIALSRGRGLATWKSAGDVVMHEYVEAFELPEVRIKTTERGQETSLSDTRTAVGSVASTTDRLLMASGETGAGGGTVVDVYDHSGRYLHSIEFPIAFRHMKAVDDVVYALFTDGPFPALVALRYSVGR